MSFYSTQFVDPSHPFPRLGRFHGFWLAVMALACALASIHPLMLMFAFVGVFGLMRLLAARRRAAKPGGEGA